MRQIENTQQDGRFQPNHINKHIETNDLSTQLKDKGCQMKSKSKIQLYVTFKKDTEIER